MTELVKRKLTITTEYAAGIPENLLGKIKLIVPAYINFIKIIANAPPINEPFPENEFPKKPIIDDQIPEDQIPDNQLTFLQLFTRKIKAKYSFSTAAPSPAVIKKIIDREVPESDILHIATGDKLSHLQESASSAADDVNYEGKRRMEVVNTNVTACGVALVALEAEKLRAKGLDFDQIKEALINDIIPRVHVMTYVDSIYYPLIGGRVKDIVDKLLEKPQFVFLQGKKEEISSRLMEIALKNKELLDQVKGLLKIEEGEVVTEKIIPFFNLPLKRTFMQKINEIGEIEQAMVVHFDNETKANELAAEIKAKTGIEPIVSEIAPSIAAHHGRGGLGFAVLEKKKNSSNVPAS
jgi:fatty acid-binding protein DegV